MPSPGRGPLGILVVLMAGLAVAPGCARRKPHGPPPPREDLWAGTINTPIARYDLAKKLYVQGRYSEAVLAFSRWLEEYPKNPLEPAVLYYLARSQYNAGLKREAKATVSRLEKTYPNSDWAMFARRDLKVPGGADAALAAARPKRHWWNPADWFEPVPPVVQRFDRARKFFYRRQFEKALPEFHAVAEGHPQSPLSPASWYYLGRCYEKLARLEKARETYQKVIKSFPETEWSLLAKEDLERLKER